MEMRNSQILRVLTARQISDEAVCGYHSTSFLYCPTPTCVFDPVPRAAIGRGLKQAGVLLLVAEIWHIILSLSLPLRIFFGSCRSFYQEVGPYSLDPDCRESKAQTPYMYHKNIQHRGRALAGREGEIQARS